MNDKGLLITMLSYTLSLVIGLLLTPALIVLSHKYHIFDKPDVRKIHTQNTSRLGGIGIFLATMITAGAAPLVLNIFLRDRVFENYVSPVRFLVIGAAIIIFLIGVLDDFYQMRPHFKFLGQLLAALMVCSSGVLIDKITIPFIWRDLSLGWFSWPLTILWIIGITNAVNLIDGLDGLAGGICIVAGFTFAIIFVLDGNYFEAIFCLTLVGSVMGYMFYNFPPAKIFMGDSGSLFLGFVLAVIPFVAARPDDGTTLYIPATMLFIPILDVFASIVRRLRKSQHFFMPDKDHIHHKLVDLGLGSRGSLAWVFSLMLLSSCIAVFYSRSPYSNRRFILILLNWATILFLYILLRTERKKIQKTTNSSQRI